jgi:hypothetical protein
MIAPGGNNNSMIGGYAGGPKHIPKKSMVHDERVLKVAQVYANDSLSPVLRKQHQKMRDLS